MLFHHRIHLRADGHAVQALVLIILFQEGRHRDGGRDDALNHQRILGLLGLVATLFQFTLIFQLLFLALGIVGGHRFQQHVTHVDDPRLTRARITLDGHEQRRRVDAPVKVPRPEFGGQTGHTEQHREIDHLDVILRRPAHPLLEDWGQWRQILTPTALIVAV